MQPRRKQQTTSQKKRKQASRTSSYVEQNDVPAPELIIYSESSHMRTASTYSSTQSDLVAVWQSVLLYR